MSTQTLTESILKKWSGTGFFVRFTDGDKTNVCAANLVWVSLKGTFCHPEYVTDRDFQLTSEELRLVQDKVWVQGLTFRPLQN